jgi:dTDP-4-amino-4,6-dideoxygalactose transaminase
MIKVITDVQGLILFRDNTILDTLKRLELTSKQILFLLDSNGDFERVVTDGDVRRMLLAGHHLLEPLNALPKSESITVNKNLMPLECLRLMNDNNINHLVVCKNRKLFGYIERSQIEAQIFLSPPDIAESEFEHVVEAFNTNWLAPVGPNVDLFEVELLEMIAAGGYAAAVNSGTAALHLALKAMNVNAGDHVFCSSNTFVASANPILYERAIPTFIDSDYESWNMDPNLLEHALLNAKKNGKLPKAVICTNIYGQSADYDPIKDICEAYGVGIIEDAAESLGALYKNKPSGTLGDIGVFSFNGNKIITTSGGGMLVSSDLSIIQKAKYLSSQAKNASVDYYRHTDIGYNYRLSNLLAGFGRGQLKTLHEKVSRRREIFGFYKNYFRKNDIVEFMPEPSWSYSNRWLTVITLRNANLEVIAKIIKFLRQSMIETRHIWCPMHRQPIYSEANYYCGDKSVSDDLFDRGLCLPSGTKMSNEDVLRVCEKLDEAIRTNI